MYQIQDEEEKRKSLLECMCTPGSPHTLTADLSYGLATAQEEDFAWDDEDEDEASPKVAKKDLATTASPVIAEGSNTPTKPKAADNTVVQKPSLLASTSTLLPPKDVEGPSSGPSSSQASPRESEESYDVLSAGIHSKEASSDDSDWE